MKLFKRLSAPILFFILAASALLLSLFKPLQNWDMIGYIAAAKSFEERDIESLHSFTYDQQRHSVSAARYEEMVNGYYRDAVSNDLTAFKEQLPFYQIRPIYTGLIYLFYKAGVKIGFATHLVSGVAVVVAVVFLYFISVSFLAKSVIYVIPPLAILFSVLDLARYSTPDGLAFLAVILSAYLYLNKRITLLLGFLPLMLGIRTDLILFTIPLKIFIFLFERRNRWIATIAIILSGVIYISIGAYWDYPGWATIFYLTLVQFLTHPISVPPTLTAQHYFFALINGTKNLINNYTFFLYIFIVISTLYIMKKQSKMISFIIILKSSPVILAVICFVFVVSHFLAFPVAADRYFSAPYLIGAFSFLIMLTNYLQTLNSTQQIAALDGNSAAFL